MLRRPLSPVHAASSTDLPDPHSVRSIRVFVSSTFRDMQEERDELIKRVCPQLRQLCESRGVAWSEVDLRWGVSEEAGRVGSDWGGIIATHIGVLAELGLIEREAGE